MGLVLLIVILLILFGGVGYIGPQNNWGTTQYGGLVTVLVIVVLILLLTGNLRFR